MFSRSLRERLGAIAREWKPPGGGPGGAAVASPANGSTATPAGAVGGDAGLATQWGEYRVVRTGIEEILSGGVHQGPHGDLFIHERLYTDLGEHPAPLLRKLESLSEPAAEHGAATQARHHRRRRARVRELFEIAAEVDSPERGLFRRYGHRRMLFLDIETCGLSAAPVFLVGLCMIGDQDLVLRQLFARDYTEERALLHELGRLAGEFDFLVTFNGKSFDVPFLRDRATHHRMRFSLEQPHLDLLWMARRRWKHALPDCRLQTLEWRVLRRRRAGDISGADIPGHYHDYVKRGEPYRMLPIFHHNLLDVVAMVELIPPLFDPDATTY